MHELDDMTRAVDNAAETLRARGVRVLYGDSPEDILRILETLEEFEHAVQGAGGDLMVDEPPIGSHAQPDQQRFMLPERAPSESASRYVTRLTAASATRNRAID